MSDSRLFKLLIQIYVHTQKSYLKRAEQEGFNKTDFAPSESKTVTITLCDRIFEYYVPHLNRYACGAGEYEIRAALSVVTFN